MPFDVTGRKMEDVLEQVDSPHVPIRDEWLSRRTERIIEPELPIIDAHHHLWDRVGSRYLFPELSADLASGHDIRATIYVQCRSMYRAEGPEALRPVGEVEFANGIAAQSASGHYGPARACAAIIGHADLTLGDRVEPVVEALMRAGGGRLRGIRNQTAWHPSPEIRSNPVPPPPGILTNDDFSRGVSCLGRLGFSLDVWAYHTQLDELYGLAKRNPATVVVIDHVGGPLGAGPYADKSKEVFVAWHEKMKQLSTLPNVRVKLGGLGMRVSGFRFHERPYPPSSTDLAEAWHPFIAASINLFGPERCMFESNFPVDKGMFSYAILWNAFKRLAAEYSNDEKRMLFAGTASETYHLPTND